MTTLTVTAKGQITLKQSILQRLGIRPGQKVSAAFLPNGNLEIAPMVEPGPDIRAARGMLHRPGRKTVTLEDMQDAIEAGWAGESL
jgi:hypothetical protein